ncbi:MAG: alpha/beta hydrolase [Bacteroidota bacterium]
MMYKLLLALTGVYVLVAMALYFLQERLIFYPTKLSPNYVFSQFDQVEERFAEPQPGVALHALYFRQPKAKGVVLYLHGNAGALDTWGYNADHLRPHGYEVLMPDYRQYGKSSGPWSEQAFYDDALFWYRELQKEYEEKDIVLYGRSLGSGFACQLATIVQPKLLILETPYSSILDMARNQTSIFPVQLLLKYHMRNDQNILNINCPVHLFHGTADELIPYAQALELSKIAKDPKILTTIVGGGHNNLGDFRAFHQQLAKLLR